MPVNNIVNKPTELNAETLLLFFNGAKKHRSYQDTLDQYQPLKLHADGMVPDKLINERRPSESEATQEYRLKIYVPKTKNPIGKVIKSLSKIRRSPDWSIKYDEKAIPSRIIEGERLNDYCEDNYPEHGSVTNWSFSHLLKNQCIDPNAVVMVVPMNLDAAAKNEYYKPVATLFNSDQVIFYEDWATFAIFESHEKSDLMQDDGTTSYQTGKVFYVLTTTEYQKWEQTNHKLYTMTQRLVHGKGLLPCFKIKSPFLKQKDSCTIQESHIVGMLPSLNEAAREYSDLQAAKVQHMFPLFWYFSSKNCAHCNGTGKVPTTSGPTSCTVCNGGGKIKFSPYAHLEVEPPKFGEQATPAPPAGYIGRDVEIIKHQEESVKAHLYEALAAINMQFLDQTPLNISGEAKQTDREELNNFVYNFAEDLIATMDKVYWWINEWRYSVIVSDAGARKAMLPKIVVPQNFDLLPADYLMEEIAKSKNAKVSPLLIATLEEDYAVKKFYNNPDLSGTIKCFYELDPLPGLSVDEKNALLSNNGITQEDYVMSSYIVSFVKQAIFENKDFLNLELDKQKEIISKYAKEKITATSEAAKMKQTLQMKMAQANNPIVN